MLEVKKNIFMFIIYIYFFVLNKLSTWWQHLPWPLLHSNFSQKMTLKVEKKVHLPTHWSPYHVYLFRSMAWNRHDIGISKTVKDTSVTFENQMKASQKTGSEANFAFGHTLTPSYHGKQYVSVMSAIDSKEEEEEEEIGQRRRISILFHHRKVKTMPVWLLSSCTDDIIFSPSLRHRDRETDDRTQNSHIADPIASSHHETTLHFSSIKKLIQTYRERSTWTYIRMIRTVYRSHLWLKNK